MGKRCGIFFVSSDLLDFKRISKLAWHSGGSSLLLLLFLIGRECIGLGLIVYVCLTARTSICSLGQFRLEVRGRIYTWFLYHHLGYTSRV